MNVQFQAIVLFFLLLPGILFRKAYNSELPSVLSLPGILRRPFPRTAKSASNVSHPAIAPPPAEHTQGPLSAEMIRTVLAATVSNAVALLIIFALGERLDLDTIAIVIVGQFGTAGEGLDRVVRGVFASQWGIVGFGLVANALGLLLGLLVRDTSGYWGWDRRFAWRKYANDYVRLLTLDQHAVEDEIEKQRFALGYDEKIWYERLWEGIPVLVVATEIAGKGYLYRGVVERLEFENDGDPIFHLSVVSRRAIENDVCQSREPEREREREPKREREPERFYEIRGTDFAIRGSQVKNINLAILLVADPALPKKPTPAIDAGSIVGATTTA